MTCKGHFVVNYTEHELISIFREKPLENETNIFGGKLNFLSDYQFWS